MKSSLRYSLVAVLMLVTGACSGLPAAAEAEVETLPSDQAIADLERLYAGLQSADAGLFVETSKDVFDNAFGQLRSRYSSARHVPVVDLHRDFQQFAALARHGHTRIDDRNPVWDAHLESDGLVFPLRILVEEGEVIVAGAPSESAILPGDRIISLDGKPNPIWLSELTRNISAETPALAYSLLANSTPYLVLLEHGPKEQFAVEVKRGEKSIKATINAVSFDSLSELTSLDGGFQLTGRDARLIDENIGYLRPGGFFNLEAKSPEEYFSATAIADFQVFVDEAFAAFIEGGANHLILDLRDNPGGDNSFSDHVIAWFADEPFRFASDFRIRVSPETTASNQRRLDNTPEGAGGISTKFAELFASASDGEFVSFEIPYAQPRDGARFAGEVHVLVNRYSYSNAVSVAALIQDYDFGKIYGEPTRDMSTTYGAMEHFTLPNTGFLVGYPKAHIIRPNGNEESHPVSPDIFLPRDVIRGNEDVMLEALSERLQNGAD